MKDERVKASVCVPDTKKPPALLQKRENKGSCSIMDVIAPHTSFSSHTHTYDSLKSTSGLHGAHLHSHPCFAVPHSLLWVYVSRLVSQLSAHWSARVVQTQRLLINCLPLLPHTQTRQEHGGHYFLFSLLTQAQHLLISEMRLVGKIHSGNVLHS